jgi:hypothetical protein
MATTPRSSLEKVRLRDRIGDVMRVSPWNNPRGFVIQGATAVPWHAVTGRRRRQIHRDG